jgi:tetratricopeptide (TPR) repeat protein
LGEYHRAIDDYSNILKRAPMSWDLRWIPYHRATLWWIVGDAEAALADYALFAEYHQAPFWSDARRFLILKELNRQAEAARLLEEAVTRPSIDPWLKAVVEHLLGRRSADSLVSLAETDGQRCEANYYAAENLYQDGNAEAAREYYEACLATGVDRYLTPIELTPSNEYELAEWRLRKLRD